MELETLNDLFDYVKSEAHIRHVNTVHHIKVKQVCISVYQFDILFKMKEVSSKH